MLSTVAGTECALKRHGSEEGGGKGEEDLVSRSFVATESALGQKRTLLRPSINKMTKRATGSGVEYWVTPSRRGIFVRSRTCQDINCRTSDGPLEIELPVMKYRRCGRTAVWYGF